jgi:hypothetical protein
MLDGSNMPELCRTAGTQPPKSRVFCSSATSSYNKSISINNANAQADMLPSSTQPDLLPHHTTRLP